MDRGTFDVVVIGAGPVGENAADRAARGGLEVAIVEHDLVGGECSYWACMPSKALLRPGAVLAAARAVPGAGAAVTGAVDAPAALAGRDEFAAHWDDAGQVQWVEDAGLHLIRGHGSLDGPRRVRIRSGTGEQVLQARRAVVVATGSAAIVPDIPGLAELHPWTNREITGMPRVPESLVIVGGGVVGTEMATALADLGCAVTMLVRGDRLLSRLEPFASEAVLAGLRALGVQVHLGTSVTRVQRADDGAVVHTDTGTRVQAEQVLVATGRAPRTDALGLSSVNLPAGQPLATDDTGLVTGVEGGWLFAAGDVTGATHTTHHGKYAARVAGDVIAARFGTSSDDRQAPAPSPASVPDQHRPATSTEGDADPWTGLRARAVGAAEAQVIFTRPEVSTVGYTRRAALERGYQVQAVQVSLTEVAGAGLTGADHGGDHGPGSAALVIDAAQGTIIGATFVGPSAGELLHAATIAVVGQVPLRRLWHAVPPFPTISEVWLRLLEEAGL